jgi:hypothetical protein
MLAQVAFEDAYFLDQLFHNVEQVFVLNTRDVDRFAGELAPLALPTVATQPALVAHDATRARRVLRIAHRQPLGRIAGAAASFL